MRTKRINRGIYQTDNGFEIERVSDGWMLYQMIDGKRCWIDDFNTKREASAAAIRLHANA